MKSSILDHGYVEFIESWGTGRAGVQKILPDRTVTITQPADYEVGIIEAARQSTQGSFRGWEAAACDCKPIDLSVKCRPDCASIKSPGDRKLLNYLYEHRHNGPFEFAGMVIEVQAPIFVFREWHRHRTQSYNEMSARYAPLPDLYYQPNYENVIDRALLQTVNKQAGVINVPQASFPEDVGNWLLRDHELQQSFEEHYQKGLKIGIPKEIARIGMPVSHYSRMRASANLRNWLAFMTLRCDPNAQWEIRQYANAVAELIKRTFPLTHALWQAGR